MKFTLVFLALASLAIAKPQITPSQKPPPLSKSVSAAPDPSSPSPTTAPKPPPVTQTGVPEPTVTGSPGEGPICECGYTYCASVLMAMKKPWNEKQLTQAYCSTPNSGCVNGTPGTNVTEALYICLCNTTGQKLGDHLDLLCGCNTCLNIGPDYRGRCKEPCHPGVCKSLG